MTLDDGPRQDTSGTDDRAEQVDRILARYLDRLNSGETIDPLEVADERARGRE